MLSCLLLACFQPYLYQVESFTTTSYHRRRWSFSDSSRILQRAKPNKNDEPSIDDISPNEEEEDLLLKELSPFIGAASDWLEDEEYLSEDYLDDTDLLQPDEMDLPPARIRGYVFDEDENDDDYEYDDDDEEDLDDIGFENDPNDPEEQNVIVLKRWKRNLSHDYLRYTLKLPDSCMWKITKYAPSALDLKATTIQAKVEVMRLSLNLSDDDIRQLIEKQPSLLNLSAEDNLKPTLHFLAEQLGLQQQSPSTSDQDILRQIVLECPSVLTISIPNLQSKFQFFQKKVGFSVQETRKMILKEPKLLTSSVATLMERWQFLHKELQFPKDKLRELFLKENSRVFMKNLDGDLRPKIIFFFIMTLQMTKDEVLKLLLKYPPVMDISLENRLRPILQYLVQLEFSNYEVSRMMLKSPRFVTSALLTIKHVVGYLRFELGLEASDVRRILYQTPQVCLHTVYCYYLHFVFLLLSNFRYLLI
jgi:hypothetical protein